MWVFGDSRVIVFDIETTGLDREFDRIIELGVIELKQGEIVREYSRLFGGGKSKAKVVNEIHHITDDMRKGKPTFEERADKIVEYLSDAILIGYNITKFDYPFIDAKLKCIGKSLTNVRLVDVYTLAKKVKLAVDNYQLRTLCEHFKVEYGSHRGMGDAKSTWLILEKMMDILKIQNVSEIICKTIK